MERAEAAEYLKQMALAQELLGEPERQVATYLDALKIIARCSPEAWAAWIAGHEPAPAGLTPQVQLCVLHLAREGQAVDLESRLLRIPPGLFDLLRIPGLGSHRVRRLWIDLGIVSLHGLERACRREQVARVKGFGRTLERQLLDDIRGMRRSHGRWLRRPALQLAQDRELLLRRARRLQDMLLVGELRRALETIDEITWVVSADDPLELLGRFSSQAGARMPIADQPDSVVFSMTDTPPQRLIAVEPERFVARCFLETGSPGHVRAVLDSLSRQEPARPDASGKGLHDWCPATESEIYARAGLACVPPELREGRGEVAAAGAGRLPELIEPGDLRGVLHVHTQWSDGQGSLRQVAAEAQAAAWDYVGISDHSQAVFYANGLDAARLAKQGEQIRVVQEEFPAVHILHGIECDILPDGTLDLDAHALDALDFVVISIHSVMQMPQAAMTRRVIRAMSHPRAAILAHPSGRLLLEREGCALDWEAIFAAAAEYGVAIEFNTRRNRLDLDWRLMRSATGHGVMICINPDAHTLRAMRNVLPGVATARKGWLTADQVLNTRGVEEVLRFCR